MTYTFNECEDSKLHHRPMWTANIMFMSGSHWKSCLFHVFLIFQFIVFPFFIVFSWFLYFLACFIALATLPPVTSRIVWKRLKKTKRQKNEKGSREKCVWQFSRTIVDAKARIYKMTKNEEQNETGSRKDCFWQFSTTILEAKAWKKNKRIEKMKTIIIIKKTREKVPCGDSPRRF